MKRLQTLSMSNLSAAKTQSRMRGAVAAVLREFQRSPVATVEPHALSTLPHWRFTRNLLLGYVGLALFASICVYLSLGYHGLFFTLNHSGAFLGGEFWSSLTVLGDTRIALAMLLFVIYRHPQLLPATFIACLPTTLIIQGIKRSTEIARPSGFLDADTFYQVGSVLKMGSFPSGHSATAGVLFGLLILITQTHRNKLLLLSGLLLTAMSRVMVGAHWPVDILVGSAIGVVCALLGYWLSSKYSLCRATTSQWAVIALLIYAAISCLGTDSGYPDAYLGTAILSSLALATYLSHFLGYKPDRGWALGVAQNS